MATKLLDLPFNLIVQPVQEALDHLLLSEGNDLRPDPSSTHINIVGFINPKLSSVHSEDLIRHQCREYLVLAISSYNNPRVWRPAHATCEHQGGQFLGLGNLKLASVRNMLVNKGSDYLVSRTIVVDYVPNKFCLLNRLNGPF